MEGDESEGSDLSDGRAVDVFVECVDVHVPAEAEADVGEVSASYYAINFFQPLNRHLLLHRPKGREGEGETDPANLPPPVHPLLVGG